MITAFPQSVPSLFPPVDKPPIIYDPHPARPLGPGQIDQGFLALARLLAIHEQIILDGMGGVMWIDFRESLAAAFAELGLAYTWLDVSEALLEESDVNRLITPFLNGEDPVFGFRNPHSLNRFFVPEKLAELGRRAGAGGRTIIFGTGAALAAKSGFLVYVDVPKNEIQFRSRAGKVTNLGAHQPAPAKAMYKRFYFVDWPALRQHQVELLPRLQLVIDSQDAAQPAVMRGEDFAPALAQAAKSWFRVQPWFEPGPWGGQWMKKRFPGFSAEVPNLAWSFELISPENGLTFVSGGLRLEAAFDWLMFLDHRAVLGEFAGRFGYEFPIRFDYLDTFEGGNLSLQCHPRPAYAERHFGERFTQDETYYLMDCTPDARVFLGFQFGIDPAEFERVLTRSFREARPVDVERYVQSHQAVKHGLYLIPNGTIHCSGRNNLVLEISATPYIFTFKMYDWLREDLDGQPRPLNVGRAMENLYFDRQGDRIRREFIARPCVLDRGEGWERLHLPTHGEHFYDVHRFDFTTAVDVRTGGSPHVLNVVEGVSVVLETPGCPPQRFAFAETFVVPAATGSYRLRSESGQAVKVIMAFLKPGAKFP